MLWLKRNFLFVIGSLVGLVLLGGAGYYLFNAISENKGVDGQLEEQTAESDRLAKKDPYPSTKNIEAVKAEHQKVQEYVGKASRAFKPLDYHRIKSAKFREELATTIALLKREADQMSVSVPTNYNFSFEAQAKALSFEANTIPMLTEQLIDVSSICSVLFHGKINKLEGIKRGRASTNDPPGSADYLEQKPITNALTGAVLSPYEFSFLCFTPELAAVLEGLERSPHGFILQTLTVEPAPASALPAPEAPPPAYVPQPTYFPSPLPAPFPKGEGSGDMNRMRMMMQRYGRPPPVQQPAPVYRPAAPGPPQKTLTTVLNEKLLRATLRIEVLMHPRPEEPKRGGAEEKKRGR